MKATLQKHLLSMSQSSATSSSFEGNTSESANYCSREIFQQKSRSEDQCSWRKMPHYGINFLDWKQFWNVKPMEKGKPLEIRAQRVAPTKIRFLPPLPIRTTRD